MKILYLAKLKGLAFSLGKFLKTGLPQLADGEIRNDDGVLFVGRGLVNKALGGKNVYPKCWEIGEKADSFDYLRKVILNEETLDNTKTAEGHRKAPEKIVTQKFDYDCGWAAVSTLLLMLQREDVLKTDIYSRLEVNPVDGVKSINIKKLFDEEDIPFLEVWKADLTDVENVLKNGGVALISYQAEGEKDEIEKLECGHYSILFDIDEEFVWLIDPSDDEEYTPGFGKGVFKIAREEFDRLWIDKGIDGTIYEKWMLAVRV